MFVTAKPDWLRPLFTARTPGKRCTSLMKFASRGEVLSLRHTRASARSMFKSTTGKMTTVSGDRQRAVPRTHPTPKPVATRLRDCCLVQSLLNDAGGLQTATVTRVHQAVIECRACPPWKPDKRYVREVPQAQFLEFRQRMSFRDGQLDMLYRDAELVQFRIGLWA